MPVISSRHCIGGATQSLPGDRILGWTLVPDLLTGIQGIRVNASAEPYTKGDLLPINESLRKSMSELLDRVKSPTSTPSAATPATPLPVNTAPKLRLPTFSAKILDWPSFLEPLLRVPEG